MSLARASELCESGPRFTREERQRLRDYNPPRSIQLSHWMRRRNGQTSKEAAEERNLYNWEWSQDLKRMERDWG